MPFATYFLESKWRNASLTEAMMYFGIGFLAACLLCVAVVPLVHARAERLTVERLKDFVPISAAEMVAEKDLLRADFAMTIRRHEQRIAKLIENNANYLAALGRKDDVINNLKATQAHQELEILELRTRLQTLEARLAVPHTPRVSVIRGTSKSGPTSNAA